MVLRARATPWEAAPAWPVIPPPRTLMNTSSRFRMSSRASGPVTAPRSFCSVKNCSIGRSFTTTLPVPSVTRTRATAVFRRPVPRWNFFCALMSVGSLGGSGELEFLRLLRLVRVLRAGVHLQLRQLRPPQPTPRDHPLDRLVENLFRLAGPHFFCRDDLLPARVA